MKLTTNKLFFLLVFIFACSNQVYADWNPESLHKNISLAPLSETKYQKLKSEVIKYLKNSWCSAEKATLLMDLTYLLQPKTCVEIGVSTGSSLLPVAASLGYIKNGTVFAIDAWSNSIAIEHLDNDDPNKPYWEKMNMNHTYSMFRQMLNSWKIGSICKIIQSPSKMAVNAVGSIDFLHIDGSYSEQNSIEDVQLYLPKVKNGGYVLYSSIGWCVNGKLPRIKAFQLLLDCCEIVATIDNQNTFLVRKLID